MKKTNRAARRGFTLIEAIVVVIIIGVIAAVIGPRVLGRVGQAKSNTAASNASSLVTAVKLFMSDHGTPAEGSSIDILWERPSEVAEEGWEPYVDTAKQLVDPWGNKFVLEIPGRDGADFSVVSLGADGQPGGEGENADVVKP